MFFDVNSVPGRPGKLLFILPTAAVSVAGVNKGPIAVAVRFNQ
jgi:hypothetical protein